MYHEEIPIQKQKICIVKIGIIPFVKNFIIKLKH